MSRGVLAGYPIIGVRAELLDGSHHEVDSTPDTFRIAAALAAEDAARKAAPILLEPVMLLEVTVLEEHVEELMKNVVARRAVIDSCQSLEGVARIRARAPLANLLGFAADLRQRTAGRGEVSMRFYRYLSWRATGGDRGQAEAVVGARLKPGPGGRLAGIALPEPEAPLDDDCLLDGAGRRVEH